MHLAHLHLQPQSNLTPKPKVRNSPSRQQRRAKLAIAAQQKQAEEASKEDTEKVQTVEPTEEVGIQNVESESENPNIGKSTAKVSDEFCPDDVYHRVDGIGQEAFRCFQCRMLYIPTSHVDGNPIVTHEMCRMHIGVCKCVHCAHVLVGLAKIRLSA